MSDQQEPASYGGSGFAQFVAFESPRLWRLAYSLTRNPDDASDLTQEALVRVGLRWNSLDHSGNPAAYARTALVRLQLNVWRRTRNPPRFLRKDENASDLAFEQVELADQVAAILEQLPARQRAAMVLHYLEDLPVSDIASILRCSEGTVKSQLARARLNARKNLQVEPTDEHRPESHVTGE